MREVTKAVMGLSWAVSLFSLQQLSKVMAPSEPQDATLAQIDDVSRVVQSHLSEPLAQQFRAGVEWQNRLVDAMFDAAAMRSLDPRAMVGSLDPRPMIDGVDPRKLVQTSVEMAQRSLAMMRDALMPAGRSH